MSADPDNDFKPGDDTNVLLRKILERLLTVGGSSSGSVTLDASDVEIGGVEIKDGSTDTRAKVRNDAPDAADNGLVVRNIPSGTQAVSGTVSVIGPLTDAQLRASSVPISVASLPLPSGAATEATLSTLLLNSTFTGRINTQGQKTMAASTPVVLASDQSAIPVSSSALSNIETFTAQTVVNTGDIETLLAGNLNVVGPLTDAQLRASAVPVSGPLTDAQLRATPVPVSGTVAVTGPLTDTQLRASPVPISAAALPLPSGAATEGTLGTLLLNSTFTGRINTQGQKTMAASTPVVIASDQSAVPVSGPLTDTQLRATPVPVSGTVTASGPLTDTQLRASAVPISATQLPAALVGGRLDVNNGTWLGSTAPTVGQKTMANSVPVVVSSDQSDIGTKVNLSPSSPTFATVGVATASAVASNANRKGLVLINTSGSTISLGFGASAVLNSGITLFPGDVFVMDEYTFYTGVINAIAGVASSNLAVQEFA